MLLEFARIRLQTFPCSLLERLVFMAIMQSQDCLISLAVFDSGKVTGFCQHNCESVWCWAASLSPQETLEPSFCVPLLLCGGGTHGLMSAAVIGDLYWTVCVLPGPPGTWSSSLSSVLQVDPKTGAAVAREAGVVTIYYEIPGSLKTYREVRPCTPLQHCTPCSTAAAGLLRGTLTKNAFYGFSSC